MPARSRPVQLAALLAGALSAALLAGSLPAAAASAPGTGEAVDVTPAADATTVAPAPETSGVTVDVTRLVEGRPVTTSVTAGSEEAAAGLVDRLEQRGDVLATGLGVEYVPTATTSPTDPLLTAATHLVPARAPEAWSRTTGSGVVVAVLDTGVLADHPDLRGALLPQVNVVAAQDDAQPGQVGSHGTMVSSIIASRINGVGTVGVAPGATILPVRICAPTCTSAAVATGIDRARTAGADVINLSIGGPGFSAVVHDAVQRAVSAGIVVVASSGNDGSPCTADVTTGCGNPVMYPAAYDDVVSVAAATPTGAAASWAVHNDRVDLSAVGEGVVAAVPPRSGSYDGSEYARGTGTSFSAPQVAGAAALVRALAPALTPAEVERVLVSSAAPASWPAGYGSGQLDVAAAVAAAAPVPAPAPAPAPRVQPVVPQPDGSVRYTRGERAVVVEGAILDRYRRAGGHTGSLGWPLTDEVPIRGGAFTHFEHGSVYWSPATGAQVVKGAVRDRWAALGWELSPLGYPAGEEFPLRGGVAQRYTGGLVYWTPATGAHEVRGAILDAYGTTGWENGVLGYPVTGEVPVRGGAFTHFERGSVYWSPATGAQVVRGAIRDAWSRSGWELGRLSYPTTGERAVAGGVRQDFQGGSLTYGWSTRLVSVALR